MYTLVKYECKYSKKYRKIIIKVYIFDYINGTLQFLKAN